MIQIGKYNTLIIKRDTSVGLYLGNIDNDVDILLPHKYCPNSFKIGDELTVFVYLDQKERLVSTTLKPLITLGEFAVLEVNYTNENGAFMNWGLEKDILVPFKEQVTPMEIGKKYLVHLYLDNKTNRLVASSKINQFLNNVHLTVAKDEEVSIIISHFSELGINVIVNEKHKGLVYKNEIFDENLKIGEKRMAYIKNIREDNKLDISLQMQGFKNIEPHAQFILSELEKNNGYLHLNDSTDPEVIKKILKMSKKNFKKAIGNLYKNNKILIKLDGIHLAKYV